MVGSIDSLSLAPHKWRGTEEKADLARRLGISLSQLYKRLAKAREVTDETEVRPTEVDEAVVLHLTEDPGLERNGWYSLRSDRTSHDGTGAMVLVGTGRGRGLRRNRLGSGHHVPGQDPKAKKAKFRPKGAKVE